MKIILTNLPAFYKINLYNEINKEEEILVIYFLEGSPDRNKDFYYGEMKFPYIWLKGNLLKKMKSLLSILLNKSYDELLLNGWDKIIYWFCLLISSKRKNSLVLESSEYESSVIGLRAIMKKVFLRKISKVYASGSSHCNLLRRLKFKGEVTITKGVGLKRMIDRPPFEHKNEIKQFLYVGRFVEEKNLEFLIRQFNKRPDLTLTMIGFGEQEPYLKSIAKNNIKFMGAVDNKELDRYYQLADVFILPSKSETWGLVVEEALNNGLPCLVSNRVGCAPDLIQDKYGLQFELNEADFEDKLNAITNAKIYNNLRMNIYQLDFKKIHREQVQCYLS